MDAPSLSMIKAMHFCNIFLALFSLNDQLMLEGPSSNRQAAVLISPAEAMLQGQIESNTLKPLHTPYCSVSIRGDWYDFKPYIH